MHGPAALVDLALRLAALIGRLRLVLWDSRPRYEPGLVLSTSEESNSNIVFVFLP
jgi:hypothetical protein